jgi:hypothetical protein
MPKIPPEPGARGERLRQITRVRRRVAAGSLVTFAVAWGTIAGAGSQGATTTTASIRATSRAGGASSTTSGSTAGSSAATARSEDRGAATAVSAVTTRQS